MVQPFGIFRTSNNAEELDAKHLEKVRVAIERARQALVDYPSPDTFAGRKTQEPFPIEKDFRPRSRG
jgi:hypothetical protein